MEPEQQLEKLHEMMTVLNEGNATQSEVVELFGMLFTAIKEIRADLEARMEETATGSSESVQETLDSLKATEERLESLIREIGKTSQASKESLKKEFKKELRAIREAIPTLPDFKGMLAEVERKIPQMPKAGITGIKAGRNIEIEGDPLFPTITNTNPKITVSKTRPKNPKLHDIWIEL